MTPRAVAVLRTIHERPGITISEIVAATGFKYGYVKRVLQYERTKGTVDTDLIEGHHKGAWRNYLALKAPPRVGPGADAVVEKAIRINGPSSCDELQRYTGYGRKKVRQAIALLAGSGRISKTVRAYNKHLWCITKDPTHAKEAR